MVGKLLVDADAGWMPLYLSFIAGMSTCLGALVVFCHPLDDDWDDDGANVERGAATATNNRRRRVRFSGRRKVSPATMAFSLALAGSVMVTVSVVSIGPECLAASSMNSEANDTNDDVDENSFFVFGITFMPILSWEFLHRLVSFLLGSLIYFILSKYAFPEPEAIISSHSNALLAGGSDGSTVVRQKDLPINSESWGSVSLRKSSDAEDEDALVATSTKNASPMGSGKKLILGGKEQSAGDLELMVGLVGANGNSKSSSSEFSPARKRNNGDGLNECMTEANDAPYRNKGVFRRPPAERTCCPTTCSMRPCCGVCSPRSVSYLRTFMTGSDLPTMDARRDWRVAMLLFVSLLVHNFPEGLAVAASALESDQLGMTVTVGIMIHNIPEGIAIAIPCLAARPDSPWLSFALASASGLAEPAGAFVALLFLWEMERRGEQGGVLPKVFALENVLAFVAGIMITVSLLELYPEARRHAKKSPAGKKAYYAGTIIGVVVMLATEFGMSL